MCELLGLPNNTKFERENVRPLTGMSLTSLKGSQITVIRKTNHLQQRKKERGITTRDFESAVMNGAAEQQPTGTVKHRHRDLVAITAPGEEGGKDGITAWRFPPAGSVHSAEVKSVKHFGAFVALGAPWRDGLVHVSKLRPKERPDSAVGVVSVGQKVFVEVLAQRPGEPEKISLSMASVDQTSGKLFRSPASLPPTPLSHGLEVASTASPPKAGESPGVVHVKRTFEPASRAAEVYERVTSDAEHGLLTHWMLWKQDGPAERCRKYKELSPSQQNTLWDVLNEREKGELFDQGGDGLVVDRKRRGGPRVQSSSAAQVPQQVDKSARRDYPRSHFSSLSDASSESHETEDAQEEDEDDLAVAHSTSRQAADAKKEANDARQREQAAREKAARLEQKQAARLKQKQDEELLAKAFKANQKEAEETARDAGVLATAGTAILGGAGAVSSRIGAAASTVTGAAGSGIGTAAAGLHRALGLSARSAAAKAAKAAVEKAKAAEAEQLRVDAEKAAQHEVNRQRLQARRKEAAAKRSGR